MQIWKSVIIENFRWTKISSNLPTLELQDYSKILVKIAMGYKKNLQIDKISLLRGGAKKKQGFSPGKISGYT